MLILYAVILMQAERNLMKTIILCVIWCVMMDMLTYGSLEQRIDLLKSWIIVEKKYWQNRIKNIVLIQEIRISIISWQRMMRLHLIP